MVRREKRVQKVGRGKEGGKEGKSPRERKR